MHILWLLQALETSVEDLLGTRRVLVDVLKSSVRKNEDAIEKAITVYVTE